MGTEPTHHRSLVRRWFDWILPRRGWVFALSIVWAIAGVLAFFNLKRDLFPDMSLPVLSVLIQSPGRSTTELELSVAQPTEQALGGMPGVRRVTSQVLPELLQVVVTFESGTDPWRARQLVAERLGTVAGGFPAGTRPPLLSSASGRLQELMEVVLEGEKIDPLKLRDHAEQVLVPRLQAVAGVARVERLGGQERSLSILLIPERMRTLGIGLDRVMTSLEESHQDLAAGVLEIQDKGWFITVGNLAATSEEIRRLAVQGPKGFVTLGELAEVREAPAFRRGLARHDGHEDVSLRIVKQPTAASLDVAEGVRAAIGQLRQELPKGMLLEVIYDQGRLVTKALNGVTLALLLGGLLVAVVLVVLLGSFRGALLVLTVLPLATFGAAIPLHLAGLGLNAMTLGGLAIAVGLLVDASVIMVENLAHRLHQWPQATGAASATADGGGEALSTGGANHHHQGPIEAETGAEGHEPAARPQGRAQEGPYEPRRVALTRASAEVAVPILTAVLVILAVFIPLLSMGGVAGKLYAPLGVAVASAMTISLILSFTLVPALVDRFLPPELSLEEPKLVVAIKAVYRPALDWAMSHGPLVMGLAFAVTLPSIWLALRLGSNFLPALDEGAYMLLSKLPAESSLDAVDQANLQLDERLKVIPGVHAVYRRSGRAEVTEDPCPITDSEIMVILEPDAQEKMVGKQLLAVAEAMPFPVEVNTPMQERIAEGIGGTPADIQVKLFNRDLVALQKAIPELQQRLGKVSGVRSVSPDTPAPMPRWRVVPDDEALRRLEVPRMLVSRTLRAALQGLPSEARYEGPQRIERVVHYPNDGQVSPQTLKNTPLVLDDGRVISLGQVVVFQEALTPTLIRREGGQRRIGLNVRTDGDLGSTAQRIEAALAKTKLPEGTFVSLGGKIEEARETQRRLWIAIASALALVVGLLYLALKQWREVFVVLATLPNAFAGALLALWLVGETWNISSIVGLIGLFGVAVQNSLVLITQAKGLIAKGMPFNEALREASLGRVRPKLMTAGAAILGLLPMLFGFGGSELERPLAVAMVGGLITSTLFTLLALPSFYAWVATFTARFSHSGNRTRDIAIESHDHGSHG